MSRRWSIDLAKQQEHIAEKICHLIVAEARLDLTERKARAGGKQVRLGTTTQLRAEKKPNMCRELSCERIAGLSAPRLFA